MKSYLFDTSVIVAGFIQSHPYHLVAQPWIAAVKNSKINASLSTHGLAEIYSVFTKLPLQPGLSADFVAQLIETEIETLFSIIDLSTADYRRAIERCRKHRLKGGVVYDALHLQACLKKKLHAVVTLNAADFELLAGDEILIVNPMETKWSAVG